MKIAGRKVLSFIINIISILLIYFITLFRSPEVLSSIGPVIIGAIITNGVLFIGANSADKFIKSKWFNKELLDK